MRRAPELIALLALVAVFALLTSLSRDGGGIGSGGEVEARDSAEYAAELFKSLGHTEASPIPAFPYRLSIEEHLIWNDGGHGNTMELRLRGRPLDTVAVDPHSTAALVKLRTGSGLIDLFTTFGD